jgi:hypothetical protein
MPSFLFTMIHDEERARKVAGIEVRSIELARAPGRSRLAPMDDSEGYAGSSATHL